ncbi:MAG: YkgJ family cysteine cluster protein [Simkania negevensis]|nr:YkgJ family cysteine cluster protein [Simkania negevensis]
MKENPLNEEEKPWYQEGLRFKCTECGKCCTAAPGFVWLSEEDITALTSHLALSREEFLKKYTREVGERISLIEDPTHFDCIFLKNKKHCTVYKSRPKQCRTFPWWPSQILSKERWEEAAKRCEGINHPEAPLISLSEIQKNLS